MRGGPDSPRDTTIALAPGPGSPRKSLREVIERRAKISVLRAARLLEWVLKPAAFPAPRLASSASDFPHLLCQRLVPLGREDPHAHALLEAGKRTNVALAAPAFDGVLLSADHPLSFWRALGPPTAARGFRHGMEVVSGCVVPTIGGGLCLLSNALFELAAKSGFTILERHGHTLQAVPPRAGELWGLDATVFHRYVDLRFAPRPQQGRVRLEATVTGDSLRLAARSDTAPALRTTIEARDDRLTETPEGRLRENRIWRRVVSLVSGSLVEETVIAENRRRLVPSVLDGRSCLTCDEADCSMRADLPAGARP